MLYANCQRPRFANSAAHLINCQFAGAFVNGAARIVSPPAALIVKISRGFDHYSLLISAAHLVNIVILITFPWYIGVYLMSPIIKNLTHSLIEPLLNTHSSSLMIFVLLGFNLFKILK